MGLSLRANGLLRCTSSRRIAPMRQPRRAQTMGGQPTGERTSGPRLLSRREQRRAIYSFSCREWIELSSGEKSLGEFLVSIDALAELVDLHEFVRRVRDMYRARSKEQRLAPVGEERNVGRVGDRARLESGDCRKALSGNV